MQASLSSFTFGAEFEVILPRGLDRHSGAAAVAAHSGITVVSSVIGGPTDNWKVVSDASVAGNGHGIEFVSPVLKGENGLEQVRKITAALTAIGATVNQTCGLHVHVGVGRNQPVDFFKNLIKLYGKFEDAIDTIMPPSRRANSAQYCRSVKLVNPAHIDAARTKEELALALARSSGTSAKYHKVNIVPRGKPTVEFRHHSGTVNGEKAVNWIVTCLRLVAAAQAGKSGATVGATIARDLSRLDAKARAVAEAIAKPEGATAEEIRAAHNFRALSIKRQAAVAGLQVRIVRERGKERFFLVAQTEGGRDVPATLAGLFEVIDASPEEAEFLRARAARTASA